MSSFNDIEHPQDKMPDIIHAIACCRCHAIVHTYTDEGFDYLGPEDVAIEAVNPHWDHNLFIDIDDGEFSLYFSGWHAHYFAEESDYAVMIADIIAIIKGKKGALILSSSKRWLCSLLYGGELSLLTDAYALGCKLLHYSEFIEELNRIGGKLEVLYWKPSDTFRFEIDPRDAVQEYSFPRRYNLYDAVKDGVSYGSGSFERYDEFTACLKHLFIEDSVPVSDRVQIQEKLLSVIENGAKSDGFSAMNAICNKDTISFFAEHGYTEIAGMSKGRPLRIFGADVIFEKTLQKRL